MSLPPSPRVRTSDLVIDYFGLDDRICQDAFACHDYAHYKHILTFSSLSLPLMAISFFWASVRLEPRQKMHAVVSGTLATPITDQ